MAMTIVEATHSIVGGIDTHSKVHVAAALDEVGGLLGAESFGANPTGYAALVSWFESFGSVSKAGVEGTGSYGAGICRFLARSGIEIIEVDRQNRQARRNAGRFVSHPRGRVGRLILVAPWTPWAFQSRPAENR